MVNDPSRWQNMLGEDFEGQGDQQLYFLELAQSRWGSTHGARMASRVLSKLTGNAVLLSTEDRRKKAKVSILMCLIRYIKNIHLGFGTPNWLKSICFQP